MSKLNGTLIQPSLLCGDIFVFEQIDSTNEYLLNHYQHLACGTACLAESQTAGRGRRGRQWYSPLSQNLYCSLLWRYDLPLSQPISSLSLIVALTLAETFEQLGVNNIQIKWPNDIYYQGKKMGGILIENRFDSQQIHLVIGVGLNLAMPTTEPDIKLQPWSDLADYRFDRNHITATILSQLQRMLIEYQHTSFKEYLSRWKKFDLFYQQPVKLLTEQGDIYGISQGINEQGELLLAQPEGIKAFAIGEISLRLA
ncbi:biotin--[acetyl-CoA-carboxylase] ligase [Vespertiliibacter pulmonis]|uniref:biotin--[biotin carboxyl-carrier protein] ligase n=1 Tax=Vespertiliibacter pulmonis TaxID=1443036 RepID=A0A3N4W6D0_9PAST|nr:biotin--[acetyl-CoA-carboxylase] ligase [Vespertiliibacter pulmonis]QLB20984.1 biotin--[acetyl-CoA-carboxylase] ligase [Vespertiliibacter pulmonis]RPE80764.1 BirA family biotin operon repressor/biotin-[acetyl-CoA-carboxylase] ligase [Vespertiliibacter pulmonis]